MKTNTYFTFVKEQTKKDIVSIDLLSSNKFYNKIYNKIQYFKKWINPTPQELPIDIKLFPFEKTHFYTKEYKKIKNILMKNKKNNGIYYFNKQKYSLHGSIIKGKEKVDFRIHFYKLDHQKYIVEFQRRDGCHLTWYKHYQEMKKQIVSFM